MTAYTRVPANTITQGVQERKEARKKQLAEVRARREKIMNRREQHMRKAYARDADYRKYVDYSG